MIMLHCQGQKFITSILFTYIYIHTNKMFMGEETKWIDRKD